VALSELDRWVVPKHEERMLLEVPQGVALVGQLVEGVPRATHLEGQVVRGHVIPVDGDADRRDGRQPETAVLRQRERQGEPLRMGSQAVLGE
jgi:hypothetical protein